MGNPKGKSGGKGGKQAPETPKCMCEDPYRCSCGNRPERPSKGHKWDPETQQWGGKGHKQKGASGQTASKAVEATTTSVGKTTVAQWQRLPSELLNEVTKREGRPPAKYKQIGDYKFRVIVQDAKPARRGTDHDLIFVPAHACGNEEQAKEEAALLALLHMTPSIPHERKLPEPYKTTWVHAVKAAKNETKDGQSKGKAEDSLTVKMPATARSDESASGAQASTNLRLGNSFVSMADRKRQQQAKRQERNARIRKHEAVRMANRDHQVFLSAQMRRQIEKLLRGETVQWEEEDRDDMTIEDDDESDLKAYVLERLHSEGFTRVQARTSFAQLKSANQRSASEEQWDSIYEECLQWLCIHLDEDQLPEGFDPRGRTLDVIVARDATKLGNTQDDNINQTVTPLANKYGLSTVEASILIGKKNKDDDTSTEQLLWNALCARATTPLRTKAKSDTNTDENNEILLEELEALEAIFPPEECRIFRQNDFTTVVMSISSQDPNWKVDMEILLRNGIYPSCHAERLLLSGTWPVPLGATVHIKLIEFLGELPLVEPMIYEIYGKCRSLLQEAADGELTPVSLTLAPNGTKTSTREAQEVPQKASESSLDLSLVYTARQLRRPRERASFWSTPPNKTSPAISFPVCDSSIRRQRESLPAAKARTDFLEAMRRSNHTGRVVLITGDTGCGKTTQIPQFILEDAPGEAKIVVAQPRRLAATGVATRVASERGESEPGRDSVGYVVRGDTAISKNTRILFCTTGVLLRQLQSEGALDNVTHIVCDEVHERNLDCDILLGVLKECIASTPHLRIVLMSATLDADRFASYWGSDTPRLHIPGRTFPVTDFMLEDVLALTGYIPPKKGRKKNGREYRRPKKSSPWADSERSDEEEDEEKTDDADINTISSSSAGVSGSTNPQSPHTPIEELVKRVDETNVDYDMLGQLVKTLIHRKTDEGSILIFLSGAPEINNAINTIGKITRTMAVELLALHGGLQPKDQNLVFKPARPGFTKVILSTNVAETSITIPDCTVVIDSCREKQSSYDPVNRMPLLLERFAAKANLRQRRGRAGRVHAGTCYKLISQATYEGLEEYSTPEICRCALDQTLLSLLFIGVERGSGNFLGKLLDPPSQEALDSAILSLQNLGAVSPRGFDGAISLTPLGMHMAGIPAPPTVGKLLVMGAILGCRSPALSMAAGMCVGRSPFLRVNSFPRQGDREDSLEESKRQKTLMARQELFKTVGNSDHAMLSSVYMQWDSLIGSERRQYCELMGLSFNVMRDMKQLVSQFDASLASVGYKASVESDHSSQSWRTLRACVVAALAPGQLVRVQRPSTKYAETLGGAKEKETDARELKFFIQVAERRPSNQPGEASGVLFRGYHGVAEESVFVHPSSANFSTGNFSCPWLVYHELVRTSKPFLRDATECSAYALLLFGGKLEVQAGKGLIVVADWVHLSANARIGALVGGLRKTIDKLLAKKIENPIFDITSTTEMKLVRNLIMTDGLGSL